MGDAQTCPFHPLPGVLQEVLLLTPLLESHTLHPLGKLSSCLCNVASFIHSVLSISLLSSSTVHLLDGFPDSFLEGWLPSPFCSPQLVKVFSSYFIALPCTVYMHVPFNHLHHVTPTGESLKKIIFLNSSGGIWITGK